MGIRGNVARSTIADANSIRNWKIYTDLAYTLIATTKRLYGNEDFGVEITNAVYAFDSTTIDLCLSLFPRATFRTTKSAIKLHTLLDLRGNIPDHIWITEANIHDVNILDELITLPNAIYIMDRGYIDFARLYTINLSKAFYGTSSNAVKTQIWIAISTYVIIAIMKKQLNLEISLYTILQFLSVSIFEKVPLKQALTNSNYKEQEVINCKQLQLFDL